MTREYYSLDEEHMSFQAVMSEEFQFKYSLPGQQHNIRRIPNSVIAKALSWQRTRASNPTDPFFKEFSTEFLHGFEQELQAFGGLPKSSDWMAVPCFPMALKVIARLTTKSLFGEPLCRDPVFLDLCCEVGDSVPRVALLLRCIPAFARPYLAKFLRAPRRVKHLQNVILDEIKSRRDSRIKNPMRDLLDFSINWVDEQQKDPWEDWHITDMMTNTVFAALHTSSQLVVHTIFELAARPEYVAPLREEIKERFATHGEGSKEAIDSMHKMDSFIKETQRFNALDASALARLVLKPYTFSNGLHVPEGTYIFTPNSPLLQDERFYEDPTRFDGFRFARMRDDSKLKASCPLTATSEQSMHFGIGRHACPGRFMVSDEVKLVMIHLLLNFDFAIENFGPRPKNVAFGKFMLPDMGAKVWLKKANQAESTGASSAL
ncbi:cytochrome p450 [Hirsutella rhossiliensis]|uniref:Cytochrome p450 domain-containing protein n=1 Tax=Hirsutella rhossiliensis TaxID=111463 RepID=A0A9P8MTN9_9HYPO|nr:cytochrome p450 domain-containing protein [Hirsutella rhossiliensis]KAH0960969.1 cytochrome p450 domain-containing protein [Hirsutella rhossiliensis]